MVDFKWIIKNSISLLPYKLKSNYAFKPKSISIGVNSECNSKCIMCDMGINNRNRKIDSSFTRKLNKKNQLSLEDINLIISKIKRFKPTIHINTTEPLLHPNIGEIIKKVRLEKMNVTLTTNGLLLKTKAKKLASSDLNELIISLDGYPQLHNKIRGIPKMYEIIKEGVTELRKYSKMPVVINFTVMPLNYSEIEKSVIKINKDFSPKCIIISHMNYIDDKIMKTHNISFGKLYPVDLSCVGLLNPKSINPDNLYKQLEKVKNQKNIAFYPKLNQLEVRDYYLTSKILKKHNKCTVPWKHFQIAADGEVYIMTRCFDYSFGNILKEDLKDIWNGQKMKRFRLELLKSNGAFPGCARCCAIY